MTGTVAVLGSGSIGTSFAIVFARSGYEVSLWDPSEHALESALGQIGHRLDLLARHGLLKESEQDVIARVHIYSDLERSCVNAVLVQECAPERADIKRELFDLVAPLTGNSTPLASSSSALTPSDYATGVVAPQRIIGAHPANPPYLLPLIELIPSPMTDPDILTRAESIYKSVSLVPITVPVEIEGFVMNRLQGAVLREAYCLVRDGVATVDTVDAVMRTSLGPRWSFMGPFETVDLNTQGGIQAHASKLGPAYHRMGLDRGMDDPWTDDLVGTVTEQRRASLPLNEWNERVKWRDEQLMRLACLRHEAEN